MKNILSYIPGIKFTGKEIMDWAQYQVEENTSHARQGKYIQTHYNLFPERTYIIHSSTQTFGRGEYRKTPYIIRV